MKKLFSRKNIVLLGLALILFLICTLVLHLFDSAKLSGFGPLASLYFNALKSGFAESTIFLCTIFIIFAFFEKHISSFIRQTSLKFNLKSKNWKAATVLIICIIFGFSLHYPNIMNGYFLNDDFEVIDINRSYTLRESLFVPHGDHTIPLFRLEMYSFLELFGNNPLPYNIAVFLAFALVPFFTYLIFQRLGFGNRSFIIFLILYASATGWADILTGYYDISTYLQISLFCTISVWSFIAWKQSRRGLYLYLFALSLLTALFIDLPGVWVYPVIFLLMVFTFTALKHQSKKETLKQFIKENKKILAVFVLVGALFIAFMAYNFHVSKPSTFLNTTDDSRISMSRYGSNMMKFFSTGMTQSLLMPNVVKIVGHPSIIEKIRPFWLLFDILLFFASIWLIVYTYKNLDPERKKLFIWILLSLFIIITLIVVKRPLNDFTFDADFKYGAMPYYFYCLLITLILTVLMEKKKISFITCLSLLLVIISAQHALGFEAIKKSKEAQARRMAVENFGSTFFDELDKIDDSNEPVSLPNLGGNFIYREIASSLADYILFFDVSANVQLLENNAIAPDTKTKKVQRVTSLRQNTSKTFIETLKTSEIFRSYYFYPARMSHLTRVQLPSLANTNLQLHDGILMVYSGTTDPEKKHLATLEFETIDEPGNLELIFHFKNDFSTQRAAGFIKIDDSIPFIKQNGKRFYSITTDLLQLYSYSLSTIVSNISIEVPDRKNVKITKVNFE